MAIYHCSIKNISRSSGKSIVAAIAYRAGEKIKDFRTGITHNYTHKKEIVYSEILLCENAPKEYKDRSVLWNEVEKIEKASNSRLAREWEVAIPNELTLNESKELIKNYAKHLVDEGMCVDINIHWKENNHHAHIVGTTRAIKINGEWAPKTKKIYELDEQGNKIPQIDKKTGLQKVDKQNRKQWKSYKDDYTDWNKKEKIEKWREKWANECNKILEKANIQKKIDHRSFERQGINKIPTIHEGYVAKKIEKKGGISDRCETNREIIKLNKKIKILEKAQEELSQTIKKLKEGIFGFLQRFDIRRNASKSTGGTTNRNRKSPGRTIGERIESLRSDNRSREIKRNTTNNSTRGIEEIINDIEIERNNQRIKERQSDEKRQDSIIKRTNREIERERQKDIGRERENNPAKSGINTNERGNREKTIKITKRI